MPRVIPQRPTKAYLRAHAALYGPDGAEDFVPVPPRSKPVQHEARHQHALTQAVQKVWWSPYFSHWPNERPQKLEAWRLSGLGVRKGMPDNWLFLPRNGYAGAVSELKAPETKRKPTKEQEWWLALLKHCGFYTGWHTGWDEQFRFFHQYAGPKRPDDPPPPPLDIDDAIPSKR